MKRTWHSVNCESRCSHYENIQPHQLTQATVLPPQNIIHYKSHDVASIESLDQQIIGLFHGRLSEMLLGGGAKPSRYQGSSDDPLATRYINGPQRIVQ